VPKDKVLVGIDLSGIELRCLAHYMKDDEYTKELLEGDIHTKNQKAAGLDTRAQAKTFIYATLYGAGPDKIGSIVGGGAAEGRKLLSNFLKATPALKTLQDKVAKIAEKGTLPGLDGRRLHVRSPHAALNTLLQSAGAIVSKQWLVCLRRNLMAAGIPYKQINYSHDEVELEVDKIHVDNVKTIAVDSAAQAGEVLEFRCKVDAEAKHGTNWYDVH
jgi:DNA polymerase I-like protein with 3'-5' exonuclease and polymerase domains